MRKASTLIASLILMFILVFQYSEVRTNEIKPNAQRTGAPSELTCGTADCHNNTPNSGTGNVTISFNNGDNAYIPGHTYEVTVSVAETGMSRFGFECTSLSATNDSAGIWLAAVSGSTAFPTLPGNLHRKYVSHFNASSNSVWVINWKAPVVDKGPLTFYAAGNAANGNELSTGDHIYTSTLTIISNPTAVAQIDNTVSNFVAQNPVSDQLAVCYQLTQNTPVSFRLYNLNGQLVKVLFEGDETGGPHARSFYVSDVQSGLYLLRLSSSKDSHTEKIIIE